MKELVAIQSALKAPKGQKNTFGNYKYRSCEDILEAVKPLLAEHKCTLIIQDDLVLIGDRYYVKATALLTNSEGHEVEVSAFAREAENKKGMDSAQVTGATSSYARKYSLNGLLLIDDNKDADTDEFTKKTQSKGPANGNTTPKPQAQSKASTPKAPAPKVNTRPPAPKAGPR